MRTHITQKIRGVSESEEKSGQDCHEWGHVYIYTERNNENKASKYRARILIVWNYVKSIKSLICTPGKVIHNKIV